MKKLILTAALGVLCAAPVSQANAHDYHAPKNHHAEKNYHGKHGKHHKNQHKEYRHEHKQNHHGYNNYYNRNFVIQRHYVEKRHGPYCAHLHKKPQYTKHYEHNDNHQRDKNLFEIIFKFNER